MRRKDSAIGFRSNMLIVLLLIAVLIGCSDEEPIVISPEVPETENPDKEGRKKWNVVTGNIPGHFALLPIYN